MDIGKENTKYLASLLANCGATQDVINDLSFNDEVGFFESNRLADWFVSQINFGWRVWQAVKAQAVPEGFVLVPKEIPKSFDEGLYFYSNSISVVNEHSDGFIPMSDIDHSEIWKLVIEAQEQSHE